MLSARMFRSSTFSIPDMQALINGIRKIFDGSEELTEKAKNVFKTVMDVNQQLEAHTPTITDESTKPTDKVERHGQHKGTNILGKLLGPAGLFLLNAMSAEALPAGLIIKSGAGMDVCQGLVWCIGATINNATTNEVLAAVSRDISLSGYGGSYITEWALSKEFDFDTLKNVTTKFLDAVPDWHTDRPTTCTAIGPLWTGTQITGTAMHLSSEACDQFKETLNKAANEAGNWRTSLMVTGIAIGMTLAGILAVVILAACCIGASCLLCPKFTNDLLSP